MTRSPQIKDMAGVTGPLKVACSAGLWACMSVNHPKTGLSLDGWKSCSIIIIFIVAIIILVIVTITIIMSGSGICSSKHLRSQEVREGPRLHSRFKHSSAGAQSLYLVSLSGEGLGKEAVNCLFPHPSGSPGTL